MFRCNSSKPWRRPGDRSPGELSASGLAPEERNGELMLAKLLIVEVAGSMLRLIT